MGCGRCAFLWWGGLPVAAASFLPVGLRWCFHYLENGVTQTEGVGVSQTGGGGVSHTDFEVVEWGIWWWWRFRLGGNDVKDDLMGYELESKECISRKNR